MEENTTIWNQLLQQSHKKNFRSIVYVQMTNLRRNGEPSLHNIRFHDFVKNDSRYLLFLMAFNDNQLHGDVKSNPNAQLCWQMQTTKEIYNLSGRFYIVSSPKKITRFPPPKSDMPTQESWETVRRQVWSALSSQTRATFTWPPSGEIPKSGKMAFKCLKLDSMLDDHIGSNNSDRVDHEVAFDNFCLLTFKVHEVIRFEYGSFPPKRTTR
ncbi:2459_t:CDS:2 [Funneliformis geosporum]|uniref:2459_t:CDS:1 n=1 Tax=Funneliformis geosporum TaxID=1117311 RepID=A0A9W4WWW0_9GLOM|nr:2459_t:CDS:2 [Funneliformis geosporum]